MAHEEERAMNETLNGAFQKGMSAIVSAAMVLLMLPAVPAAHAADDESYNDYVVNGDGAKYGIPTSLVYNNHGNGGEDLDGNPKVSFQVKAADLPGGDGEAAMAADALQKAALGELDDATVLAGIAAESDKTLEALKQAAAEQLADEQPGLSADDITMTLSKDSVDVQVSNNQIKTDAAVTTSNLSWTSADVAVTNVEAENGIVSASYDAGSGQANLQALSAGSEKLVVSYDYKRAVNAFDYQTDDAGTYSYTVTTKDAVEFTVNGGQEKYELPANIEAQVQDAQISVAKRAYTGEAVNTGIEATGSETVDVTVSDLFASLNSTCALAATTWQTTTVEGAKLVQGAALPGSESWAVKLLNDMQMNGNKYLRDASFDESGVLSVVGKRSGEGDVPVEWTLPDGSTFTCTLDVTIEPTETLSEWTLENAGYDGEFRLQADTEKEILAKANAYLKGLMEDNGEDMADAPDFFTDVTLEGDYDATGRAQSEMTATFATLDDAALAGTVWEDYAGQIKCEAIDAVVQPMVKMTWENDANLTVAAGDNSISASDWSGDECDKWFNAENGVPAASYAAEGAEVAYGVTDSAEDPLAAEDFQQEQALSAGDGVHTASVFVRTADGIIHEVTDVKYQVDTQAPKLISWDVAERGSADSTSIFDKIFFSKDRVTVNTEIVDEFKNSDEPGEIKVSGIDSVKLSYTDDLGGAGGDASYDKTQDGNIYPLVIEGDADVQAKNIDVEATDIAGNNVKANAEEFNTIPSDITRMVADANAPELSVSYDNNDVANGKYFDANRTLTVTISDTFFGYLKEYRGGDTAFTISRDGKTAVAVHLSDFNDEGVFTYHFTQDGDWKVSKIVVNDLVGRTVAQDMNGTDGTFTIDKTAPTLDVSFDNNDVANGKYYKATRTATLVVIEHNFSADLVNVETNGSFSGWKSDGDTHVATVSFGTDGIYSLAVNGQDLATNGLNPYESGEFVVDLTMPTIEISGVSNSAYGPGESATPGVHVHDTNVDAKATTIGTDGVPSKISDLDSNANPYVASVTSTATDITAGYSGAAEIRDNDGIYTLTVNAYDLAGNTATQSVTWSVNRFGSTFYVEKGADMLNTWSQVPQDLTVVEVNPSGVDDYALYLSRDNTTEELKGSDVTVTSNHRGSNWYTNTYAFDKALYEADGSYSITISSTDNAANVAENNESDRMQSADGTRVRGTISFGIDDTAPNVTVLNPKEPENGQLKVKVEDNGVIKSVQYYDKTSPETVLVDATPTAEDASVYTVPVADSYDVQVIATDMATNASAVDDTNMMGISLLVIVLVVAAVIVIALVAYFIWRRKQQQQS